MSELLYMYILLLHLIKNSFFKKLNELIYIKKFLYFQFFGWLTNQSANPRQGGLTYSTQIINADWPIPLKA